MDELRVVAERLKGFLDETGLRFDLKSGYRDDGKQYYECRREWVEKNIIYYEDKPGHMLYEPDPSDFYRPPSGRNKRIRWPNDWIDPYPPTIDLAYIYDDHISITIENEFDLDFMCGEYYAISLPGVIGSTMYIGLDLYTFKERADRTKAARFIPAVIKDMETFEKSLRSILEKNGVKWLKPALGKVYLVIRYQKLEKGLSEVRFDPFRGYVDFILSTVGMGVEEGVDSAIKWIEAMIEHRKRYRHGWLPSEERRRYYEDTYLHRDDPFRRRPKNYLRYIIKWPLETGNENNERKVERDIIIELERNKQARVYNLDGYGLKAVDEIVKDEKGDRVEKKRIIIDKGSRLYKFPLEKMEFLKEDFPELWRQ